jgi:CO/xanthine dehydrogenase FAD-binding subunit
MDFTAATDLSEALAAKKSAPEAEFLAGGTDLMVEVNLLHHRPESVIGLRKVEELRVLDDRRIGSGVTWARLEKGKHRALAQLARTVGSPQIRAAGTIGGNIGTSSPAGDGLPWIVALDAGIEVASAERGSRVVPWDEFFVGVKRNSLEDDELILSVVLPDEMPEIQEFAKIGVRNAMVISTVSCVVIKASDGYRIALGSSAPTPIRARRAETFLRAGGVGSDRLQRGRADHRSSVDRGLSPARRGNPGSPSGGAV